MKFKREDSKQWYALITITSVLFILGLSMMILGGTVTEYDYSVTVTPVDSMNNIDSSEVVEYSSLTKYEKELIQEALENSAANTKSEYYDTVQNNKNVVTNNRVVNINGVISYVNISESSDKISDQTGQTGFGLLGLSVVMFILGLAGLSERNRYQ